MKAPSLSSLANTTILILFWVLSMAPASGQYIRNDVISAGGNTCFTGNIYLDFTIGEISTESCQNTGIFLTQGFHQPFGTPSDVNVLKPYSRIKVYPNPAEESITIEIPIKGHSSFIILYDAIGQEVYGTISTEGVATINTGKMAPGIYFLRITDNEGKPVFFRKIIINH